MPAAARAGALTDAAELIAERAEEVAETITAENGKPLGRATAEVRDGGRHVPVRGGRGRRLSSELRPRTRGTG